MKIIGFNLEKTHFGLPLDNGGACLIMDGKIKMLINEERLNRKQYSPGFKLSLEYILKNNNLTISDIDYFIASSCLEPAADPKRVQKQLKANSFDVPLKKIKVCDHHLSHAFSAYYPSGFNEAIILVLDGDGNVLTEKMKSGTDNTKKYWLNKIEHNSYYIAKGNEIGFLERDEIEAGENGFGGAYRYFTYFCGFPGYKYAGKLMGLSAYESKRNRFRDIKLFDLLPSGQIKCLLPDSDRLKSPSVVEKWLRKHGIKIKTRNPQDPITKDIEDIAFLMQKELDRALIYKVNYLVEKTGITNLCIAGGVGLNAVTNRAILDKTKINNIFIQPAAGDSGQALGNAYFGVFNFDKKNLKRTPASVYQGKEYSENEIGKALENEKLVIDYQKMSFDKLSKLAARKIKENYVIGWFQGRSEMGPRALGNRSILASPANSKMKDALNLKVKHRENFRPFAPSVLREKVSEWFDIDFDAPYMIINAQVKKTKIIPAVTHKDGSARLQTVSEKNNKRYYRLIKEFEKLTKIPVVINTSFNDNESIVETPQDALNCFLRTGIDYLFLGDYFVSKKSGLIDPAKNLKEINNAWSQVASQTSKIQNAKSKVLNDKILSLIKKYIPEGSKIFDYTCEWGEYANLLAENGYKVGALNESDQMVIEARKKFTKPIFYTKKEFQKNFPILREKFDMVMSNLWLCILEEKYHGKFIENLKKMAKKDGLIMLSFCHPAFDYMRDSIVTHRIVDYSQARYDKKFKHKKIVHENGLAFEDYHRPLPYYISLFKKHGLKIVDIAESKTLNTNYYPDFIIFILKNN